MEKKNIVLDIEDFFKKKQYYKKDDQYKLGEEFRDTCLIPALKDALDKQMGCCVMIDSEHSTDDFIKGCFTGLMDTFTKNELSGTLYTVDGDLFSTDNKKYIHREELIKQILNS